MNEADKKYIVELLSNYLKDGEFYGKIELNIQNSRIITVNVTKGHRNLTTK